MNLIKPNKLKQGDTIAIIAPSGEVDNKKLDNAVNYFTNCGYKIKCGLNIRKQNRYMAGSDEQRIQDLHNAFLDKDVKAIIAARGGYGAIRLINKLDYEIIKNNPKIFCGYSDITALSAMILKKTGLITFSGPMTQGDFQVNEIDSFTEENFFNTVRNNKIEIFAQNIKIYNKGNAKGQLFGGNLATIVSLCGLDFIPDNNFLFFTEDLNEPVYKIDKYLNQLLNIDKFRKNISAIVIGDLLNVDNKQWLDDFFAELSNQLDIPIISGYPISHSKTKATIPYGADAILKDGIITAEY